MARRSAPGAGALWLAPLVWLSSVGMPHTFNQNSRVRVDSFCTIYRFCLRRRDRTGALGIRFSDGVIALGRRSMKNLLSLI